MAKDPERIPKGSRKDGRGMVKGSLCGSVPKSTLKNPSRISFQLPFQVTTEGSLKNPTGSQSDPTKVDSLPLPFEVAMDGSLEDL